MTESLLNQSVVRLYGRAVSDLKLDGTASQGDGATTRLQDQLSADGAQLARIYGFEHDGHYYDLPSPAIFLVHGDGRAPADSGVVVESDPELEIDDAKIRVWVYDKADFSIRLDIQTGTFEDILMAATENASQQLQASGMRVSGMRVSGMRVSGMRMKGGD